MIETSRLQAEQVFNCHGATCHSGGETVSQFVIPAKPRGAGREPGSGSFRYAGTNISDLIPVGLIPRGLP